MNDKIKKVLKYIGVGVIGFLFGVGSLIGVSSCAQHNNNSAERTASFRLDTKKQLSDTQYTFTFNELINPYYKYGVSVDTPYVAYVPSTGFVQTYTIDTGCYFKVEGSSMEFNAIELVYADASGQHFKLSSNYTNNTSTPLVTNFDTEEYMYFNTLTYVNTRTTYRLKVLEVGSVYGAYNYVGRTILCGVLNWVSNTYRNLTFYGYNTGIGPNTLAFLNALNDTATITSPVSASSGVGLEGVFTLLTTAFSSLVPLLQITIVPGITIGLLLFIPLITGIILLVIWLVKR